MNSIKWRDNKKPQPCASCGVSTQRQYFDTEENVWMCLGCYDYLNHIVLESDWKKNIDKERESDTHPCDHYHPAHCTCKGSCGCHWI